MFDFKRFDKELLPVKASELVELEHRLHNALGSSRIDLSDTRQVVKALYNNKVYPESLSLDWLKANRHIHAVYELLFKHKKLKILMTQYGGKLQTQIGADGRVRGTWEDSSSLSGRMCCRNPNLQAFPGILKPYFCAEKGNVLVNTDYNQIELRILAEMSREPLMLKAFIQGNDIHRQTAATILGIKGCAVTEEQRQIGKKLNFALSYGITAYGIVELLKKAGVDITQSQANAMRAAYYDKYTKILQFHNHLLTAEKIVTLGGQSFAGLKKGERLRLNLPLQATAAEGLKASLSLLMKKMPSHWLLCNVVHDSVVIEVPKKEADVARELLGGCMVQGMSQFIRSIPVGVDTKIGVNWL